MLGRILFYTLIVGWYSAFGVMTYHLSQDLLALKAGPAIFDILAMYMLADVAGTCSI